MKKSTGELLVNNRIAGSCAIISKDGYIITASHCIKHRDDKIEMNSSYGRIQLKLIALDKGHDLMLLKAPERKNGYSFLAFAKKLPTPFEKSFQFGAPLFRQNLLQSGTIASKNENYEYYSKPYHHSLKIFYMSAILQSGTSGGPWVNTAGELIGVQSGVMSSQETGIAFMSSYKHVQPLLKAKKDSKTKGIGAGVTRLEAEAVETIARYTQKSGVIISYLQKNGVADKAGLKQWDLVLSIDNIKIKTPHDYYTAIQNSKNDTLTLKILKIDKVSPVYIKIKITIIEELIKKRFTNSPTKTKTKEKP